MLVLMHVLSDAGATLRLDYTALANVPIVQPQGGNGSAQPSLLEWLPAFSVSGTSSQLPAAQLSIMHSTLLVSNCTALTEVREGW
jgi:hypothetical protein